MSTATISNRPANAGSGRTGVVKLLAGAGAAVLLVAVLLYWFGSGRGEKLPQTYGQRRGREAAPSVNGTSVLAEMFKRTGRRVTTVTELSPKLRKFETLVWFPDDFEPPTKEQREFLENWLAEGPNRTLVYVGRDYDAAAAYWKKVQPLMPTANADEVQRELARAQSSYDSDRAKMPKEQYSRWFTSRRDGERRDVRTLQGPWAKDVDAKKVEISLEGRLDVPVEKDRAAAGTDPALAKSYEVLLESDGDPLIFNVWEEEWGNSEVIVVANGSFVLNYPLVNHEHRKLASQLIERCWEDGDVAFVESDAGGPPVSDKEPSDQLMSGLSLLKVWPLNAIVLHLTIFGIVLCLARSAIFGRARELPAEAASDFGKHVSALGQLLARTKDRNYALGRLQQYRQQAQRASGKSHRKPA